uniref:Nucleolus and neural progenitor protein n=1 Tax=Paramormyrops kingsleyae TaxID=1676925 RepID=A0A3B3SUA0_9TELE
METFHEENVRIAFGGRSLDAVLSIPGQSTTVRAALVLTHGAGGDMNVKHLVSLAKAAAAAGLLCLRFTCKGLNLSYRVKAYTAVMEYLRNQEKFTLTSIFVGGRSMGARAAACLTNQLSTGVGDVPHGLVCLSFPLHPPGQTHTHRQRSEDLRSLAGVPVLFVSGTADDMCQRSLLEDVTKHMKSPTTVQWIEGGSHGLVVKGRAEDEVLAQATSLNVFWRSVPGC